MNPVRPAWREPMVWLVIGLPLAAIAASLGLVAEALRAGPDDAVIDEVKHTAQMQVGDTAAEQEALTLGLSATLLFTDKDVQLVPVSGGFNRDSTLRLTLAHPVDDGHDIREPLSPSARGWTGAAVPLGNNDWVIQLEAADGRWRLRGRLPRGQQAVLLRAPKP